MIASLILLEGGLDFSNPYVMIIAASAIIVLSYLFNIFSAKTNVPSVLLLIITGIGIKLGLDQMGVPLGDLRSSLELLGIIGLIMIVLEAALDLELTEEKLPLVWKSLLIALLCLLASAGGIAFLLQQFIEMPFTVSLLYATPLSIMSSAIIIPSVTGLILPKKEFMVYESAFSDILGIMLFYFFISLLESGGKAASLQFAGSLVITIIVAIIAAYALVFLFKDIKGHIRLFLLIAVLLMLYSGGKLLHLSPLLIILIFGLALSNHHTAFKIFRNSLIEEEDDPIEKIEKEFHLITLETAFVVRTFFFVVFGMTIDLASLVSVDVAMISVAILAILYVVRFIFLRTLKGTDIIPELWIAPRGLITILLFFAIPKAHIVSEFNEGILLYVIIISSLIMTGGLIGSRSKQASAVSSETSH